MIFLQFLHLGEKNKVKMDLNLIKKYRGWARWAKCVKRKKGVLGTSRLQISLVIALACKRLQGEASGIFVCLWCFDVNRLLRTADMKILRSSSCRKQLVCWVCLADELASVPLTCAKLIHHHVWALRQIMSTGGYALTNRRVHTHTHTLPPNIMATGSFIIQILRDKYFPAAGTFFRSTFETCAV
jgi:hypothetical protein